MKPSSFYKSIRSTPIIITFIYLFYLLVLFLGFCSDYDWTITDIEWDEFISYFWIITAIYLFLIICIILYVCCNKNKYKLSKEYYKKECLIKKGNRLIQEKVLQEEMQNIKSEVSMLKEALKQYTNNNQDEKIYDSNELEQ